MNDAGAKCSPDKQLLALRAVLVRLSHPFFAVAAGLLSLAAASPMPISTETDPARIFREAAKVCERDSGRFWGQTLCGPMLLVDPTTRRVIANEPDREGVLTADGAYFTGTLPSSVILSNTPVDWAGKRWTELLLPVRPKGDERILANDDWLPVELAHELFHRIQGDVHMTRPEGANHHLDTFEGRYLMQLEWRALTKALTAHAFSARNNAIVDALMFRQERYRLFPKAANEEMSLEINEGIPEYTGVMLGLQSPDRRTHYAARELSAYVSAPTLVRSFAYATGPAYGLLLDQVHKGWRDELGSGRRLDELLQASARVPAPADLRRREAAYDDGSLRASEERREKKRQGQLTMLKGKLVDGPVLILPLSKSNFQFNPQMLVPLDDEGTVYPWMRLSCEWGTLIAQTDVLLDMPMATARISAIGIDETALKGPGWTLELKKGWRVAAGARNGDLIVKNAREEIGR